MKKIIITGASSGIGRNLALEFAKRGYDLGLTARRYDLLKTLKDEIHSKYGGEIKVELRVLDVTMYKEIFKVFRELNTDLGGITHVIANAGRGGSKSVGSGNFLTDREVIETNLLGGMATVEAAAEIFKASNIQGHIIGISSIAGFRGFPGDASYCASKAGFTAYLESARLDLKKYGIHVTSILPGFIDTPINSHMKERPFVVSAEEGARKIANLIERKVDESAAPVLPWLFVGWLLKLIPNFIWKRIKFR